MKRILAAAAFAAILALAVSLVSVAREIRRQSVLEEARAADVILVLGAAEYRGKPSPVLKARLSHALDLYRRHLAPRIITTGGPGGDPFYTEGGVGRAWLIDHQVPSEAIIVEPEGYSTVYSTHAALEIMHRMGLKSCIVVSDGYHIFRVKKMLEFRGIHAYGSPRPSDNPSGAYAWWQAVRQSVGYVLWSLGVPV